MTSFSVTSPRPLPAELHPELDVSEPLDELLLDLSRAVVVPEGMFQMKTHVKDWFMAKTPNLWIVPRESWGQWIHKWKYVSGKDMPVKIMIKE